MTTATEAYGTAASCRAGPGPGPPAAGRSVPPGAASTHGVGVDRLGRRGRAAGQPEPVAVRARARGRSVRVAAPPAALQVRHQRVDERGHAPDQAGEHRPPVVRPGQRRAWCSSEPPFRASARTARGDACEGQLPGPPGVDPAEQRLQQPVGHLRAEPFVDVAADGDVRRRAASAGRRARRPRADSPPRTAARAARRRRSGTPSSEGGIRCRRPPTSTPAVPRSGAPA